MTEIQPRWPWGELVYNSLENQFGMLTWKLNTLLQKMKDVCMFAKFVHKQAHENKSYN